MTIHIYMYMNYASALWFLSFTVHQRVRKSAIHERQCRRLWQRPDPDSQAGRWQRNINAEQAEYAVISTCPYLIPIFQNFDLARSNLLIYIFFSFIGSCCEYTLCFIFIIFQIYFLRIITCVLVFENFKFLQMVLPALFRMTLFLIGTTAAKATFHLSTRLSVVGI